MTPRLVLVALLALLLSVATAAVAQQPAPADAAGRPWLVVGGASSTILGDCADCEEDVKGHYRHSGAFLANAGVSVNSRADVGAEVLFVPSKTGSGETVHTTFVMAVAQFRFWKNSGFFVKTGMGMGFVKNWVVDLSGSGDPSPPFTSKALALGLAAGWEWRLAPRLGVQVFGTQHVVSLGDLEANQTRFENVVGNYWLVGGGIVIR